MGKKKSVKKWAEKFKDRVDETQAFLDDANACGISEKTTTLAYELAIIKLYNAFERLMLDSLVGTINNRTSDLAAATGVRFPKDMTDKACEFLIVRKGYFDFKGRSGLIEQLKTYLPATHYLPTVVSKPKYKDAMDRLCALRNFAAHDSESAKRTAKATANCNMGSAGSWLKVQGRYEKIADRLVELADELHAAAPY